ncbi:tail fiber domain-containing protein, partial [Limnobacter sp.]|uniref:tail fiber domain-containing protein n=1 Tax=Limnobacter sp. TaxID=2003368 RepID=UPI0025BDDE70
YVDQIETDATQQATNAAASATAAASSATASASSASAAATSETNASTSASTASTQATNAASSATAAASSATNASSSATAAQTAQTAAETAKTGAETAETNAETAKTAAQAAQTAAETAETNAETAETNAAASATAAATSATNAGTSATNAATSATSAASSATSASSAQTAAESARDSALASLDSFDDRYLGSKTTDPTVDNDGDALVSGALYFNSTDDVVKVYTGSAWVVAYSDGTTLVSKSGDTMTGALNINADLTVDTNTLHVDSANNKVGFGTTTPATSIHTKSTTANQITLEADSTTIGPNIVFKNTDGNLAKISSAETNTLRFETGPSDTERMRITSDGNVGIGNTAPARHLSVNSGSSSGYIQLVNTNSGTGASNGFEIKLDSAGSLVDLINRENGDMRFLTNNTERMRIDSSGNVGIGTSSPSQALEVHGTNSRIYLTDANEEISMNEFGDGQLSLDANGYTGAIAIDGTGMHVYHNSSTRSLILGTNETCRFEIDGSGRIGLGPQGSIQTNGMFGIYNINYSRYPIYSASSNTYAPFMALFQNASHTTIGSIRMSGTTGVSYNTSSDYRLKENVTELTDGITRIKELQPKRFNFIDDPDRTVDGFVAHEVTAVPEAISGEKDEVDDEGNPKYQGIDQSKLVPLLTAALQEAIAKIEDLETRVAALEAD